MKKLIFITTAAMIASSSALAIGKPLTAKCGALEECYAQVQASCQNPVVIDREQHYGDLLFEDWPGRWPYFTIIYSCQ